MSLKKIIVLLWAATLPIVGVWSRKPKKVEPEPPMIEETDSIDLEENDDFEELTEGMPVGVLRSCPDT